MKTAITAASGALGNEIVQQLAKEVVPEKIIALARTVSNINAPEGVEKRSGDYEKPAELKDSLSGVETLLLVSGNAPPDIRLGQHKNAVDAAKSAGVRKLVYTGIAVVGKSPIAAMSKETEDYIIASGMDFAIGRNGLYIEPDLEYVETYKKEGGIVNSAGEGRCSYTSRSELAQAYAKLITDDSLNGGIYSFGGPAITQRELTEIMNQVFGTNLEYKEMTPEDYLADRQAALGEFIGTVISDIYTSIRNGLSEFSSDFETVVGRPHKTALEIARESVA